MFQQRSRSEPVAGGFDWLSLVLLLGAVLVVYYLVPLVSLAVAQPPGRVLAQLSTPRVAAAATTSLATAATSTTLATVFGVPLAYWLARTDGPAVTALAAVAVLPLVLPPIVSGMVLLTVVGPDALGGVAGARGFALTRSFAGVVLAQTFVASPFVVVTATAAFEGVDPTLEHASRSLGTGRLQTVRNVTLPLAWPGILAGVTLAFARAIGEFGATVMLAYYPRTMPIEIWVSFTTRGIDAAFPLAVVLLAVSVGTLLALHLLDTTPLE